MTLAEVTAVIEGRCAAILATARAASGNPNIPNLTHCVGWATRMVGGATASVTTVTDGEVGAITGLRIDALLDLAELRTLESVLTNLNTVDLTTGPVTEDFSDLPDRLAKMIPEKRKAIGTMWRRYLALPFEGNADKPAGMRAL